MGYIKRIDFLKGLVNTTKLTSPVDRVAAVQMLPKSSTTFNDSIGPNITTQIHQKTSAKYNRELRAELFHSDKGISISLFVKKIIYNYNNYYNYNHLFFLGTLEDGIRQRLTSTNMHDDDLGAILKYNRNIQEKIAENMLSMTSSIKEHALAANAIIKKDIGLLEKSDKLTDVNTSKLKTESLKLQEQTQSYWRCWMWVMIAFVLVVFFSKY